MKYTPEHYGEFQESYANESDRSVGILAATYLEQCLAEFLLLRLVDHSSSRALFDSFAPLSSFSGKIEIAFAIGLIPEQIYDDLRRIKKIRNLFAHELDALTFDSPKISKLCDQFFIPRSDGSRRIASGGRGKFLNGVFWALIHIYTQRERTSRLSVLKLRFEEVVEDDSHDPNRPLHPTAGDAPV